MTKYWRSHPPLQAMVQGYLGIEAEPEKAPDLTEFFASVQQRMTTP